MLFPTSGSHSIDAPSPVHLLWFPAHILNRGLCSSAFFLASFIVVAALGLSPLDAQGSNRFERDIKASLIYKFIFFTEWPQETYEATNGDCVIAVIGDSRYMNSFAPVYGSRVENHRLRIIHVDIDTAFHSLPPCHIAFFTSGKEETIAEIIRRLRNSPVMVISEQDNMLLRGAMVNLLDRDNSVSFEVNQRALAAANIDVRAKMLRLALRVID